MFVPWSWAHSYVESYSSGLCSIEIHVFTSRARAAPDCSYSVSVCPSIQGLHGEAWKWVNGGSRHICMAVSSYLVCSPPRCKRQQTMPVLSTVEAQLSLHKRNIAKAAPEAREWQETGGLTMNKPRSEIALVLQYSVSHKRVTWSSGFAEPARKHQSTSR